VLFFYICRVHLREILINVPFCHWFSLI
jgi:hypothetical protein